MWPFSSSTSSESSDKTFQDGNVDQLQACELPMDRQYVKELKELSLGAIQALQTQELVHANQSPQHLMKLVDIISCVVLDSLEEELSQVYEEQSPLQKLNYEQRNGLATSIHVVKRLLSQHIHAAFQLNQESPHDKEIQKDKSADIGPHLSMAYMESQITTLRAIQHDHPITTFTLIILPLLSKVTGSIEHLIQEENQKSSNIMSQTTLLFCEIVWAIERLADIKESNRVKILEPIHDVITNICKTARVLMTTIDAQIAVLRCLCKLSRTRAVSAISNGSPTMTDMDMYNETKEKSKDGRWNIIENGGIDYMMYAMRTHASNEKVMSAGLAALSNCATIALLFGHQETISNTKVKTLPAPPALSSPLRTGNETKSKSIMFLSSLVDMMMSAMMTHIYSADVQMYAICTFYSLLGTPDPDFVLIIMTAAVPSPESTVSQVPQLDLVSCLMTSMEAHTASARVQEWVCGTVKNILRIEECHKYKSVATNYVKIVDNLLNAMSAYPDNVVVQEHCCQALYHAYYGSFYRGEDGNTPDDNLQEESLRAVNQGRQRCSQSQDIALWSQRVVDLLT